MSRQKIRRYEKLLKFQTQKRDAIQQQLTQLRKRESEFRTQRENLIRQKQDCAELPNEDIAARLGWISFVQKLDRHIQTLSEQLETLETEINHQLQRLSDQHTKVKSWEKLLEKTREEWRFEVARKGMIEADERYLSKRQATPASLEHPSTPQEMT